MASEVSDILENQEKEPETKREKLKKNLEITFSVLGIAAFLMTALVNYYTLKKQMK